jgi:hypothetical protein
MKERRKLLFRDGMYEKERLTKEGRKKERRK